MKLCKSIGNLWLTIGCVVSVIILLLFIFNTLVPFTFLSSDGTKAFNRIIEALSVSYLTGVLVYYITTEKVRAITRERQKWPLYDLFMSLAEIKNHIETEMGVRCDKMNTDDYIQYYSTEVQNSVNNLIMNFMQRKERFNDILTNEEQKLLSIIETNSNIDAYSSCMTPKEVDFNFQKLKTICSVISQLNNNIITEVQK